MRYESNVAGYPPTPEGKTRFQPTLVRGSPQTYLGAKCLERVVEWHLDDHETGVLYLFDSYPALIMSHHGQHKSSAVCDT